MNNRTILVINQYYRPDVASSGQLLAELCEFLSSGGITVHVVTGQPSYTTDAHPAPKEELLNGVIVHRVSLGKSIGKNNMATRFTGYCKFLWGSWILSRKVARTTNPNLVITLSNPPIVGLLGGILAKTRKIPFIYILYDIHPDILIATKWMNIPRILIRAWNYTNSFIFKCATTIIVPSSAMKATLIDQKSLTEDKIKVIANWARPEVKDQGFSTSIKTKLGIPQDHVMVLYAGNIGIMQQLDPILDAAIRLSKMPIHFLFLGEGEKKSELIQRVTEQKLTKVHFLPYQPEQQFSQIVLESNACFVTLQPGLDAYSAPSRAYTFLSAGTAIITLMHEDTELAKLITNEQCGWNVVNGDQLCQLLENLLENPDEYDTKGNRAKKLYLDNYHESIIMDLYLQVIKSHMDIIG